MRRSPVMASTVIPEEEMESVSGLGGMVGNMYILCVVHGCALVGAVYVGSSHREGMEGWDGMRVQIFIFIFIWIYPPSIRVNSSLTLPAQVLLRVE